MSHLSTKLSHNHPLYQLDPLLYDGITRVGGRLSKGSLPLDARHPIVLPISGNLTRLIHSHCHEKTQHQGRGQTLNEIRANGYWISEASKAVGSYLGECIFAERLEDP